jgi:hypothetical protein
MKHKLFVRNLSSQELQQPGEIFIFCVGFEKRSRFYAGSLDLTECTVLAIKYANTQILSFEENLKYAAERAFNIVDDNAGCIEEAIRSSLEAVRKNRQSPTITVDVSAMDRFVMARVLVTSIKELRMHETLHVIYAPAQYRQPNLDLLPIRRIGAVHADLAGELDGPDAGRSLLLGLGYEYGVSLHVLDTHEPDISFIFRPIGFDQRFAKSVEQANFGFDFGERNYEVIDYYLSDIAGLYDDLSSLVVSMKHETSIVGVPLGPKILSAAMIVVGLVHQPRLSVLRYSLAPTSLHQDVDAAGTRTGISISRVN